jgi:hypothetical protein
MFFYKFLKRSNIIILKFKSKEKLWMILKNMLSISTQFEREKKVVNEENYKEK